MAKISIFTSNAPSVDRRTLLGTSAVSALVATFGISSESRAQTHSHGAAKAAKDAKSPAPTAVPPHAHAGGRHAALINATRLCLAKADACLKHCIALLNKGDTSLVDCMKTVTAMTPICRAVERYAVIDAKHLRDLARLCVVVNTECEVECRKHAEHHTTCKDCADACAACITECNKLPEKAAFATDIGGAFELTAHTGQPFSSKSLAGRPFVVLFGYTSCPSFCPTALQEMSTALADLGRDADQLSVLFVTVDPERDTCEHLKSYLSSFDSRITGLTGDPVDIAAVAQAYKAFYLKNVSQSGYTIDHTVSIYLMDRKGHVTATIPYDAPAGTKLAKLRNLIHETNI